MTAAVCVQRQFAAVGGIAFDNKGSGLAAPDKTQILETKDRQMRKACLWQANRARLV
jgi:hypothetical protein